AHCTAAVNLDGRAGMWHVIVVDRQASTAQIRTACQPDAVTGRQAPNFVQELRALHHRIKAVSKTTTGDPQMIDRHGKRRNEVWTPDLHRREPQVLSNLIQMDFKCKTRLRRAVPTLWATRRLVGENPKSLEAVMRDLIGDCL